MHEFLLDDLLHVENCGIVAGNADRKDRVIMYEQVRKNGLIDVKNMIRFDCRFIWAQMPYKERGSK